MSQIVKQTWDERYRMYMSLPKEELARMLAESAKITNPDGCAEISDSYPQASRYYTDTKTHEYKTVKDTL